MPGLFSTPLRCLIPALLLGLTPAGHGQDEAEQPAPSVSISRIDDPLINESSGLARSQRRDDLLWTLNDSGGDAALYGITPQGHHAATLTLRGDQVGNIDWEDLASFSRGKQDFMLVGDMGDNFAWRSQLVFYLIREPRLGELPDGPPLQRKVDVLRRYQVTYPDGPRDAEALAVDGRENMAYVISKRDARPALYRFSLKPGQAQPIVMEALGAITIPRAGPDYRDDPNAFNWVTAMDFDDSLSRAYVGTLTTGYLYPRRRGESWQQALSRPPQAFELPRFPQVEGGGFARHDSASIYVSSEQLPAGLALIRP